MCELCRNQLWLPIVGESEIEAGEIPMVQAEGFIECPVCSPRTPVEDI